MPLVFSALEQNTKNHWNRAVLNLTQNLRNMFSEMDAELLLECQEKFEEENSKLSLVAQRRKSTWERLENAAGFQPAVTNVSTMAESSVCVVAC